MITLVKVYTLGLFF